jgi:hypothetical protein
MISCLQGQSYDKHFGYPHHPVWVPLPSISGTLTTLLGYRYHPLRVPLPPISGTLTTHFGYPYHPFRVPLPPISGTLTTQFGYPYRPFRVPLPPSLGTLTTHFGYPYHRPRYLQRRRPRAHPLGAMLDGRQLLLDAHKRDHQLQTPRSGKQPKWETAQVGNGRSGKQPKWENSLSGNGWPGTAGSARLCPMCSSAPVAHRVLVQMWEAGGVKGEPGADPVPAQMWRG